MRGRQDILELYLQDKPVGSDVNVNAIARSTPGFNGAGAYNFPLYYLSEMIIVALHHLSVWTMGCF